MTLRAWTTVDSAFWQAQGQRFGALRQDAIRRSERLLDATYHPAGWGLERHCAFRDYTAGCWLLDRGTSEMVEDFKSIAGLCAVALGLRYIDVIANARCLEDYYAQGSRCAAARVRRHPSADATAA